jgi:hypothetical protein
MRAALRTSTASGGERNTGMDNAAVNRQASVDAPSPSSLSSYGVARSDSRPNAEEPSQSEDQPTMVAELLSASQLSDLPQQHLSDESRSESLPRRHSLPEEELARMRALGEQELARMRALGITFGTELSRQTEQEAASRGETLTDMAQGDGLLAALLLLQVCVCTFCSAARQTVLCLFDDMLIFWCAEYGGDSAGPCRPNAAQPRQTHFASGGGMLPPQPAALGLVPTRLAPRVFPLGILHP